jgi:hypothetical protein
MLPKRLGKIVGTASLFRRLNVPSRRTPLPKLFYDGRWGERTRLACRFGRRARNIVGQLSLTGFRRDAENGNRDGCALFLELALRGIPGLLGCGWQNNF